MFCHMLTLWLSERRNFLVLRWVRRRCGRVRRRLHLTAEPPHLQGAPLVRQLPPHALSLGFPRSSPPLHAVFWLTAVAQSVWGLVDVRQVLSKEIQQLAAVCGRDVEGNRGEENWVAGRRNKRGGRQQTRGTWAIVASVCCRFIFLCWNRIVFLLRCVHACSSSLLHAADCTTGLEPAESQARRRDRGGVWSGVEGRLRPRDVFSLQGSSCWV